MSDKLKGRVAQILNERELVINLGREKGVKPSMIFAVMAEQNPVEIRDPESGEVLDIIDREKVRVEATEVRDKISICKTYRVRKTEINWFDQAFPIRNLPGWPYSPYEYHEAETLRSDEGSSISTLAPEASYVKIGDRVVEIVDTD